jgi:chromosomal replication initiator protein
MGKFLIAIIPLKTVAVVVDSSKPVPAEVVRDNVSTGKANNQAVADKIIALVAKYFRQSEEGIRGTSKKKEVATARHAAMYILFRVGLSYSEIARRLQRDHTTVMYAVEKLERAQKLLQARDPECTRRLTDLEAMLLLEVAKKDTRLARLLGVVLPTKARPFYNGRAFLISLDIAINR